MNYHVREPFPFERVGCAYALDLTVSVDEGSTDEFVVDLNYAIHDQVDRSSVGDLIRSSSGHGLTIFHRNQGRDSSLGQPVVHGHVV